MSKYSIEINGFNFQECPHYTSQQTIELIQKYQQTYDTQIKEKLIYSNMKLVLSLAQKYHGNQNIEDYFQVGIIGLIQAIDHFDNHFQVRFSTYAVPLIVGEMKKLKREHSLMRIPRSLRDLAYQAINAKEEFHEIYGREPTHKELSIQLKSNEKALAEALRSMDNISSFSQEVKQDESGILDLESQIASEKDDYQQIKNHIDLSKALNNLNQQEYKIINERYYQDKTQIEIAQNLYLSQAQVSRIEKQALSHLKKLLK